MLVTSFRSGEKRLRASWMCLLALPLACGTAGASTSGAAGAGANAGAPASAGLGAGEASGMPSPPFSAGTGGAGGHIGGAGGNVERGARNGGALGMPTSAGSSAGGGAVAGGGMGGAGAPTPAGGAGGASVVADPSGGACPVWPARAAAAPAHVSFNGVTLTGSEHDCAWTLGPDVALPVTSHYTRLLFHYDVNGDGVDDLFVGPNPEDYLDPTDISKKRPVTLLVSKLTGDVLTFEPTDCVLAPPLVDGNYSLRDLDADGVPDFVIGVTNGFRVVMNRAAGLEQTVSFDFPYTTEPAVYSGDVVLGAFEQDDTSELAVGFIRQADHYATMQSGTLLFSNPTQTSSQAPLSLAISNQMGNGLDLSLNPELGIFTALKGGRALYGATAEDSWLYQAGKRTTTVGGNGVGEPTYLATITVGGSELVFAGLGSGAPPLDKTSSYIFDPADPKHGMEIPSAFSHGLAYGRSKSYLLLDVDGDGDVDLVENEAESTSNTGGAPRFAIHNGDPVQGPSNEWQEFAPGRYFVPQSETPFLAIGAARGRLLVSEGDPGDPKQFPLRVIPIMCGQ